MDIFEGLAKTNAAAAGGARFLPRTPREAASYAWARFRRSRPNQVRGPVTASKGMQRKENFASIHREK